jgi:hypothetical protein
LLRYVLDSGKNSLVTSVFLFFFLAINLKQKSPTNNYICKALILFIM